MAGTIDAIEESLALSDTLAAVGGLDAGSVRTDLLHAQLYLSNYDIAAYGTTADRTERGTELESLDVALTGLAADSAQRVGPDEWAGYRRTIEHAYELADRFADESAHSAAYAQAKADATNKTLSDAWVSLKGAASGVVGAANTELWTVVAGVVVIGLAATLLVYVGGRSGLFKAVGKAVP